MPNHLDREKREAIIADLQERRRLRALAHQYTFRAIARRYNVAPNTVWVYDMCYVDPVEEPEP